MGLMNLGGGAAGGIISARPRAIAATTGELLTEYRDGLQVWAYCAASPIRWVDSLGQSYSLPGLLTTGLVQGLVGGIINGAFSQWRHGDFKSGFGVGFVAGFGGGAATAFAASAWGLFATTVSVGIFDGMFAGGTEYYSTGDMRAALADAGWSAILSSVSFGVLDVGAQKVLGAWARATVDKALAALQPGRSVGVSTVKTAAELQQLFDNMTFWGKPAQGSSYPGTFVELPDGTTVGLRQTSKSGGPTIDITHPNGTTQKVHVKP